MKLRRTHALRDTTDVKYVQIIFPPIIIIIGLWICICRNINVLFLFLTHTHTHVLFRPNDVYARARLYIDTSVLYQYFDTAHMNICTRG